MSQVCVVASCRCGFRRLRRSIARLVQVSVAAGIRRALIVLAALAAAGAGAEEPAIAPVMAVDLGGLDTRSAALMLSAQEAGDLEISALAMPLPDRVALVADVGGASLLETVPAPAPTLITEVYAYALDAEGGLVASLTQAFRLDLGHHRSALAVGGVKFFGDLDLPAGSYSLRVLVLQRSSGRLGLRIVPCEVPSWTSDSVLLPPVRREPVAGWILVHGSDVTPPVMAIDGEPWLPSARRIVDAGAPAGYLLLGQGLSQGMRGDLLDADRELMMEVGLGDLRPVTGAPAGLAALAAELDTAILEAGEYRLRISSTETIAGSPRPSADSGPLIVRGAGEAPSPPAAEPAGLSARESRGRQAIFERYEELREGYRLTFERLASGDRAAALEPLIEIESRRIGSGAVEEQNRLATAELEIVRELSRPDPDRLLTAIWLHEALYRHYHRQKRYLLATHSRQVVSRLAGLYLERAPSKRTRRLVASALVSLGGYLQQTGSLMAAENAYHDALTHDPGHPTALLGVAAIQESYGQYESAAEVLLRLYKAQPEDTQVRLRLGVNLKRLDKGRRAAAHLAAAIAEPGADWVAAVAAQELASLHADDERLAGAVSVLEAAVERHPEVQRLKVQLAAMLDRAGRRAEALAVLDRLDPTVGSDVGSPRLRYSRANSTAIAAVRRTLQEEASRGLAALRFPGRPAESSRSPTSKGTDGGLR